MRRLKGSLLILLKGLAYAPAAAAPAAPVLWLFLAVIEWCPATALGLLQTWSKLTVFFYGLFALAAVGGLWGPTSPPPSSAPAGASRSASG